MDVDSITSEVANPEDFEEEDQKVPLHDRQDKMDLTVEDRKR